MSDELAIWHNPRCRTSRQALALLTEAGVEVNIIRYLDTPPTATELGRVLDQLGMEPRQLMRKKEAPYKELQLAAEALDRNALIAAMVAHPILIERPVVLRGDRAVLGRPPENVRALTG